MFSWHQSLSLSIKTNTSHAGFFITQWNSSNNILPSTVQILLSLSISVVCIPSAGPAGAGAYGDIKEPAEITPYSPQKEGTSQINVQCVFIYSCISNCNALLCG